MVWDVQSARTVAGRAVINHEDEIVGERFTDMAQKEGHACSIHGGQDEVCGGAVSRAERPIRVGVFANNLLTDDRPDIRSSPASTRIVDPSEPGFVLKEDP